jgi:acyl-CoA reductase-like NAD-dependent aldehyde dehydrogenase
MAFLSRNPHTGAILRKVVASPRNVIEETIKRLDSKFISMKAGGIQERHKQLDLIQSVIKDQHSQIAERITQESGKSLWLAKGEVQLAINNFQWFKENLENITKPTIVPNSELTAGNVIKQGYYLKPLGVIYQISPFNFPFWIGMNNTAKNIAMGNTIMCRPDKGSIHA